MAGRMPAILLYGPNTSAGSSQRANANRAATRTIAVSELAPSLFFTNSEASRKAGGASFARMPYSPESSVSLTAMAAQAQAIRRFANNEDGWYARLKEIAGPTFVANGDRDGLFPRD